MESILEPSVDLIRDMSGEKTTSVEEIAEKLLKDPIYKQCILIIYDPETDEKLAKKAYRLYSDFEDTMTGSPINPYRGYLSGTDNEIHIRTSNLRWDYWNDPLFKKLERYVKEIAWRNSKQTDIFIRAGKQFYVYPKYSLEGFEESEVRRLEGVEEILKWMLARKLPEKLYNGLLEGEILPEEIFDPKHHPNRIREWPKG